MASPKEQEEFMSLIAHEAPDDFGWFKARGVARLIMRSSATYKRIQEAYCNDPMDDRQQARMEKREANLEKRITELCAEMGMTPVFQGDPRGSTVKIAVPSGRTNDWGREGICVPTA